MRIQFLLPLLVSLVGVQDFAASPGTANPNIVLNLVGDLSPDLSCHGETTIRTPNSDALASQGNRFARAFVTVSNCSISRSALPAGAEGSHAARLDRTQTRQGQTPALAILAFSQPTNSPKAINQ